MHTTPTRQLSEPTELIATVQDETTGSQACSTLGRTISYTLQLTVLPTSRLQFDLALNTTRFTDPRTEADGFDAEIAKSLVTYQFTTRLLVRSNDQHNSFRGTFGTSMIITSRVNADRSSSSVMTTT